MKKFIFTLILVITLITGIGTVNANEINNFYSKIDDNLTFKKDVNGDTALIGQKINSKGNIFGIGFIAGETVNAEGQIDYGFFAGNNIKIKGNIKNSLYIAGNNIIFAKTATIGKDAFIAGENITLEGNLKRNVKLYGTSINIKEGTTINGNINIKANDITIENNVIINGTLKYNEDSKINIKNKDTIKNVKTIKTKENKKINTANLLNSLFNIVVVFIVIITILPKSADKTIKAYQDKNVKSYIKSCGNGLLILVCMPIICLMLLMSNIGVNLGLILSGTYLIALYLSYIYSGLIFGDLLLVKVLNLKPNKYLNGIIGVLLIKILAIIPTVGAIVTLLSITLGLNAIYNLIIVKSKKQDSKENIKEAKIIKTTKRKN